MKAYEIRRFIINKSHCFNPFGQLEIDVNGKCYCCCRWWNNSYCFGDIFEQSLEEIWNGEKAQELRKTILNGEYTYCNLKDCLKGIPPSDQTLSLVSDYPVEVSLCYDYSCGAKCLYCRDEEKSLSKEENKKWDEIIYTKLIPFLKNVKVVRLTMAGELFTSNHSRKLVKAIGQSCPNIHFRIVTNGIFCNEKNLVELGIIDKLEMVKLSLPSIVRKTYQKIVRNGNYIKVMENLEFIASLKSENKINEFKLNFVLSSLNYKELPAYVRKAEKLGAIVDCFIVDKNNEDTEFLKNIGRYVVANPKHPEYNQFVKVMNSSIIKNSKNLNINESLKKLKPVSFSKSLINKVKFFFGGFKPQAVKK